jgi:CheY-like chemotaxis protein
LIVSIQKTFQFSDKTIAITSRGEIGTKQLVSYSNLMTELETLPRIDMLCIPDSLGRTDYLYSLREVVEHVRLSFRKALARVPIYVFSDSQDVEWIESLHGIAVGIESLGLEDTSPPLQLIEPLSDLQYIKLYKRLAAQPPPGDTHHDRSNIWAPYRLLCALDGKSNSIIDKLESELLEKPYWRKKILESKIKTKPVQVENWRKVIQKNLGLIKNINPKVLVLEDEVDKGWKEAYSAVFKGCKIQVMTDDQNLHYDTIDNLYDIALVDLRLKEKPIGDVSDKINVASLSGMKVVDKIRKAKNILPIIMATASNKSWSYETALDVGATGYWEKESPDLSIEQFYNYETTLDLLGTIVENLEWYRKLEKPIRALKEIQESLTKETTQYSLQKKIDAVIGQLHRRQSKYIRNYYGNSGLQSAFLILWSIVNDVKDYFHHEEPDSDSGEIIYSVIIEKETHPYCSKLKIDGKYYYSSEALDSLNTQYRRNQRKFKDFGSDYFNESAFTEFLMSIKGHNDARIAYHRIKDVRNSLAWIHGHSEADDDTKKICDVDWRHIQHTIDLWYRIFKSESFFEVYDLPIPDLP